MDSTNAELVMTAMAAGVVGGRDEFCMEYITAFRKLGEGK
jgi:hypothetical protein